MILVAVVTLQCAAAAAPLAVVHGGVGIGGSTHTVVPSGQCYSMTVFVILSVVQPAVLRIGRHDRCIAIWMDLKVIL